MTEVRTGRYFSEGEVLPVIPTANRSAYVRSQLQSAVSCSKQYRVQPRTKTKNTDFVTIYETIWSCFEKALAVGGFWLGQL